MREFPRIGGTYYEPFAGACAVFFAFGYVPAKLSDTNAELINTLRVIRDAPEMLLSSLSGLDVSRETHARLRSTIPADSIQRAARFIYLVNTSWNGLYRVNKQGQFNVPFGCKPGTSMPSPKRIGSASALLRGVDIACEDFEAAVEGAKPGDLVYFDPPYTAKHGPNGFRRYNQRIFSWSDQIRLASCAESLRHQGVFTVVSSPYSQDVRNLYPSFRAVEYGRASCISGTSKGRTDLREYVLFGW